MIPTSIDGTDITGATIDGTDVTEITVDGQTVFTAGPAIIDDFESGNLNSYRNTSGFKISSFAAKGSFSLEFDDAPRRPSYDSYAGMYSVPGDGLANYVSKGQKFSCLWYADNQDGFHGPSFAVNSSGTQAINVNIKASDKMRIVSEDNGNRNSRDTSFSGNFQNEWLEIEIQWHDGSGSQPDNTVEAKLFQTDSNFDRDNLIVSNTLSVSSSFSGNQGIGFADRLFSASTDIYIDNVVLLGSVD